MKKLTISALTFSMLFLLGACGSKSAFRLTSPDGSIATTISYDDETGTVAYRVESTGRPIILSSPVGIHTDRGDFRSGMALVSHSRQVVDETYTLPHGKVSTCRNHAREQTLRLSKDGREIDVIFRAYNDGVAFSFCIPGEGNIVRV